MNISEIVNKNLEELIMNNKSTFKVTDLDFYIKLLEKLTPLLNKYFEEQKDYIFCKEGCAHCCSIGAYPCSEQEFELVEIGFSQLNVEEKTNILEKAKMIKQKFNLHQKHGESDFSYVCPFLNNNKCSIYLYRPLLCRTFGLLTIVGEEMAFPFCFKEGLNYSNIIIKETKKLDKDKVNALPENKKPLAYNIDYAFLLNNFENIKWGDVKPIFQWVNKKLLDTKQ